jgi:hypothetical protein
MEASALQRVAGRTDIVIAEIHCAGEVVEDGLEKIEQGLDPAPKDAAVLSLRYDTLALSITGCRSRWPRLCAGLSSQDLERSGTD